MRVLADVFPYMVGLAENAVQYLNIAEEEKKLSYERSSHPYILTLFQSMYG